MLVKPLVLLLAATALCTAQASEPFFVASSTGKVKIYQTSKALLIGVSNYRSPDIWGVLPTVPSEIAALKAALTRQGFATDDIEVVMDPTTSVLRNKVHRFLHAKVASDARLFLFVAGHGWSDRKESGYLLPVDALSVIDANFSSKRLGMDEVSLWSKETSAKHVMMIFDSCFSGAVFLSRGKANLPSALFLNDAEQPVRQFITSGSKDEKVPSRSAFAAMLVNGLDGAADIYPDGVITGTELGYWLKAKITPLNEQTPQYGTSNDLRYQMGDVMFGIPGAITVRAGAAGKRDIPSSKNDASAATRSEVQTLRDNAKPHRAFDEVKVYYYQKASDGNTITKALDQASIPFLKTRASLPEKFQVSTIACGTDVPAESIRMLATTLINSGVTLRAIMPFRNTAIKPRRIELVSLSLTSPVLEAISSPPLTLEQVAGITDCSWLRN
ncbi:MAG: caspase family protein [Telluria sp.]